VLLDWWGGLGGGHFRRGSEAHGDKGRSCLIYQVVSSAWWGGLGGGHFRRGSEAHGDKGRSCLIYQVVSSAWWVGCSNLRMPKERWTVMKVIVDVSRWWIEK